METTNYVKSCEENTEQNLQMLIFHCHTFLIFWYLLALHVITKRTGIIFAQMGDEFFQDFCKEKNTSVEMNMSKSTRCNTYIFYFKTVIKNAEQTTVKWQKIQSLSRGKHPKVSFV
jgi:hypothetical protein